MQNLTRYMDPFFGNGTIDLPEPEGIAATWFFIKAQTGNTHPGAQAPLSMISVGAYTGAYPTGYGVNAPNTHATPARYLDAPAAMGFSHLHQSGTGAIQTYYNYFLVTPVALHRSSEGLGWLGTHWRLEDERARPGTYAARLAGTGIKAELTATPAVALHRYTFTAGQTAQLAVDFANGGIDFSRRRTRPSAGEVALVAPNAASGWVVMAGVRLYVYMECTPTRTWDPDGALWVDTERIRGLSRLTLDRDRAKSGASFGVVFSGPAPATVELRLGFSLHSVERARARVEETRGRGFDQVARETEAAWNAYANHVQVEGGTETQKQILYSSLYHSLVKPALWPGEGPWWAASSEEEARPFYLDFATMWDQYKTQLPLLLSLYPERGAEIVNSLLALAEHVGHFPTGFVLDAEMGRFDGQARCLALMTLADAYHRRLPGIDWQRALNAMLADLGQARHADYYQKSLVTPITHTLDLAQACCCTAQIAGDLGLDRVRDSLMAHAARWRGAYDRATGRLIEGRYYEGGLWNYSFRLLHDMAGRIGLYPSEDAYVADLDRFFGYGQPPAVQPAVPGDRAVMDAGHALNRFEGYNNEPDIETPYGYLYAGRHDRCAEVVRAGMRSMYTTGRGGLPGNNDSGGLTSCYVWNAVGLYPVTGQPVYLIGSPIFDAASLLLGDQRFTVETVDNSPENLYVQRATLNGAAIDRAYLTVDEVHAGGALRLEMGDTRSGWARGERPPSYPAT